MAFPQVQSVTETTTSGATVHNINMPATVDAGDLLLCVWGNDNGSGGSGVGPSTPSGWELLGTVAGGAGRLSVFARVATGDEDGTSVGFDTGSDAVNAAAQVRRISDWYGAISGGVSISLVSGTDGADPNPPSLNPADWSIEDSLWVACCMTSDSITGVDAYPTGYTGGVYTQSGSGLVHAQIASCYKEVAADSEDPGVFSLTGSHTAWRSATIAISPDRAITFTGENVVSFDGTAAMDVVSDIVFAGTGALNFDGDATLIQIALMDGAEEVSFDGEADLSGGALLLIGEGAVSFDGTAVLNQNAVFDGISEVSMNGLIQLGVIQEFAATRAVSFDGEATLSVVGWIDVDEPFGPTWNNAT